MQPGNTQVIVVGCSDDINFTGSDPHFDCLLQKQQPKGYNRDSFLTKRHQCPIMPIYCETSFKVVFKDPPPQEASQDHGMVGLTLQEGASGIDIEQGGGAFKAPHVKTCLGTILTRFFAQEGLGDKNNLGKFF